MKPVKQLYLHDPDNGVWGDCHRAAVASVLEIPIEHVPHFNEGAPGPEEFCRRVRDFLLRRGLVDVSMIYDGNSELQPILDFMGKINPGVCYLLGGRSRTGCNHTVVCLNDKIVHDPSRTDSGIIGPCDDGFYWLTFFVTAESMHKEVA